MKFGSVHWTRAGAGASWWGSWLCLGVGLAMLFLAAHTVYVVTIRPDVVYMDSLRYVNYYFERPWGAEDIARFWNQGDHRGLLSQLVLWLNIRVLGMDVLVANVLTGFVLLWTSLVLLRSYLRFDAALGTEFSGRRIFLAWMAFLFIIFSLAGFELYTLDLGFAENLRNGIFLTLGCWLLQREDRLGAGSCLSMALALALVMLVCAYGRIYAFSGALLISVIMALLRSEWGAGRSAWICVVITVTLSLVLYIVLGALLPQGLGNTGVQNVALPAAARGILTGVASTVIGVDVVEQFKVPMALLACFGALILSLLVWVGIAYLKRVRASGSVIPVFLVTYGLINVLAVAISRGAEPHGAMASRYYPDFCWMLLGLAWMLVAILGQRLEPLRGKFSRRWLAVVALTPILASYSLTQIVETKIWPYRAEAFDAMRQAALTCGGVSQDSVSLLQANNQQILEQAISLQRQYRLGAWRHVQISCPN